MPNIDWHFVSTIKCLSCILALFTCLILERDSGPNVDSLSLCSELFNSPHLDETE